MADKDRLTRRRPVDITYKSPVDLKPPLCSECKQPIELERLPHHSICAKCVDKAVGFIFVKYNLTPPSKKAILQGFKHNLKVVAQLLK